MASLPFACTLMTLAPDDTLYLYNPTEISIYKVKLFSTVQVPPTTQNDAYTCVTPSLTVAAAQGVLANDMDLNYDPFTAALVSTPASGSVVLNQNGSFTYTPNPGFKGVDTFTYKAQDANGFNMATVAITVDPLMLTGVNPTAVIAGQQLSNVILNGGGFRQATPADPAGAVSFNGHNYLFVNTAMTWSAAQSYCTGLNGHLVTITSAA